MSVYGQFDSSLEVSAPLALVTLSSFPGSPRYYADVLGSDEDSQSEQEYPHSPSFHPSTGWCSSCGGCCDVCDALPPTPLVYWNDEPFYSPWCPESSEAPAPISARRIAPLSVN